MSDDPVETGDDPRWGLKIALGLVGVGLLAAWVAVWFVSSGHVDPPARRRPAPPPIDQLPPTPAETADGHRVANPGWRRQPTGDDVARFYPQRAARLAVAGRVTIGCKVKANSELTGCRVLSEGPVGYGFGEAAVAMSARFRMWPKTVDGEPVEGGEVRIPIVFSPPQE